MVVMFKNLVDKNFFCIKQAGAELSQAQSNLDQIKFKQVELSPTWKYHYIEYAQSTKYLK